MRFYVVTSHHAGSYWIETQTAALRAFAPANTTVVASLSRQNAEFAGAFDVVVPSMGVLSGNLNHLARVVGETADPSDVLLFLDGDAFPVRPMHDFIVSYLERAPLSAVRRDEVGDLQPHPSVAVTTVGFWQHLNGDWSAGHPWANTITGAQRTDLGGNLLHALDVRGLSWEPIRRSASLTDHSLLFGIYGDFVYHHGLHGCHLRRRRPDLEDWEPSASWGGLARFVPRPARHRIEAKIRHDTRERILGAERDSSLQVMRDVQVNWAAIADRTRPPDEPDDQPHGMSAEKMEPQETSAQKPRAAVFVVGMHRSGTSFTAGMMPFAGLRALEGELHTQNPFNEKGNREIQDLRPVNNRLMRAAGHDWDAISPPFAPVAAAGAPAQLREEAEQVLRPLVPAAPWHWKDPRLCFTLPVFLSALESDERPYAVMVFREPIEVALSLDKRDSLGVPVGLALWEAYTHAALKAVEGLPTFFVSYEQSLADPIGLIDRIHAQLLSDGVIPDDPPDRGAAEQWAEPSLRHHHHPSAATDEVLSSQRALHQWLVHRPPFERACNIADLVPPSEWSIELMAARTAARRAKAEQRASMRANASRSWSRKMARKVKRTLSRQS